MWSPLCLVEAFCWTKVDFWDFFSCHADFDHTNRIWLNVLYADGAFALAVDNELYVTSYKTVANFVQLSSSKTFSPITSFSHIPSFS